MLTPPYSYLFFATKILDGDTVRGTIELGFGVRLDMTLRLYGIDTPETKGETRAAGEAARAYLIHLLTEHQPVVLVKTHKDKRDSFGRYLAEIVAEKLDGTTINVNEQMIAAGHAVEYMP